VVFSDAQATLGRSPVSVKVSSTDCLTLAGTRRYRLICVTTLRDLGKQCKYLHESYRRSEQVGVHKITMPYTVVLAVILVPASVRSVAITDDIIADPCRLKILRIRRQMALYITKQIETSSI
jgi:hypothetical protein